MLHVLEIRLLVDVEVRVHGAVRDDRRQHDRGVDQVAGRHDRARDATGDRRRHARERQVELRRLERRADRRELRRGDRRVGGELLELFLRRRIAREQPLGAIAIRFRELQLRERALALGREPGDFRLERPRIDLIQKIACRNPPAFGEMYRLDVAADAGPDRDAFDGFEPAGEVGGFVELVDGDFGCRDLRRRRSRWGVTGFANGATHESERQDEQTRDPERLCDVIRKSFSVNWLFVLRLCRLATLKGLASIRLECYYTVQ